MAAVAFDTLKYARTLESLGVPQAQAEGQAEAMAEAFGYQVENLVTRDHLDARFAEQEARIAQRFAEQGMKTDSQFAEVRSELRLLRWILGAVAASTVLPALNALFGWV